MDHAAHNDQLKTQAKRLRAALLANGFEVGHSASLELIAKTHGHRNWNTASAVVGGVEKGLDTAPSPARWAIGAHVSGTYLGNPFTGTLVSAARKGNAHFDLAIQFNAPVNVSKSALFDAFRHRIRATVGEDGRSVSATSDGVPHLVLART
jgi:hypothetical protein